MNGLRDAPRAWYTSVKGALTELGMSVCDLDQALSFYFVEKKKTKRDIKHTYRRFHMGRDGEI